VFEHTTHPDADDPHADAHAPARTMLALALAWCRDEPWRAGEVLLIPAEPAHTIVRFGRGAALPGQPPKGLFGQLRPGHWLPSEPLATPALSRYQLAIEAVGGDRLLVRNEGRCPLLRNDTTVTSTELAPGDVIQLGNQLLLLCVLRQVGLPARHETAAFPFGAPDAQGLVGESDAAWELRRQIAAVAPRPGHVLIDGASGTGKELVAQALHALSPRAARPLVARNAATLPEALIDAELFGNAKNYPNPGMSDRAGLIGEARDSTLFLDEIAELPHAAQSHLLRVLDAGEYQRLGETTARASDFRLVAATNRSPAAIKHDLLARFTFRLSVPDLNARREDVPLLVRHLLHQGARAGELPAEFTSPGAGPDGRTAPLWLMRQLLEHRYETNVRELRALLWQAITRPRRAAPGERPLDGQPASKGARAKTSAVPGKPDAPSAEQVQRCLDENNGSIEQAWRALGLSSRFALLRLIKRYDIEVRRRPARAPRS